ncbi:homeobox protein unc-4 homolog [Trachypithecus francoisi]|uniref:homeobox protein unc-4 homolog n=1 Tax=Trachypithecus francoisi TaxID=54180 RepID=UPI00141B4910|nr:homeobox protein unc-4 homolog [Trachypithecus francoisi]
MGKVRSPGLSGGGRHRVDAPSPSGKHKLLSARLKGEGHSCQWLGGSILCPSVTSPWERTRSPGARHRERLPGGAALGSGGSTLPSGGTSGPQFPICRVGVSGRHRVLGKGALLTDTRDRQGHWAGRSAAAPRPPGAHPAPRTWPEAKVTASGGCRGRTARLGRAAPRRTAHELGLGWSQAPGAAATTAAARTHSPSEREEAAARRTEVPSPPHSAQPAALPGRSGPREDCTPRWPSGGGAGMQEEAFPRPAPPLVGCARAWLSRSRWPGSRPRLQSARALGAALRGAQKPAPRSFLPDGGQAFARAPTAGLRELTAPSPRSPPPPCTPGPGVLGWSRFHVQLASPPRRPLGFSPRDVSAAMATGRREPLQDARPPAPLAGVPAPSILPDFQGPPRSPRRIIQHLWYLGRTPTHPGLCTPDSGGTPTQL